MTEKGNDNLEGEDTFEDVPAENIEAAFEEVKQASGEENLIGKLEEHFFGWRNNGGVFRKSIGAVYALSGWKAVVAGAKAVDKYEPSKSAAVEWYRGKEPPSHARSALKGVFGGAKALGGSIVDALKSK